MNVESLDGDRVPIDLSFYLTKVIHVLTEEEDITMVFSKEAIYIEQGTFSGIFIKEYEARRDFPAYSEEDLTKCSADRLKYLISCASSLSGIYKELKVYETDPVFVNNTFYANATANSNIVFFEHCEFPLCCIPMKSLKETVYTFPKEIRFKYFKDINVFLFKSDKFEYWIPTTDYNIEGNTISVIDKMVKECKPVTTINIHKFVDRLKLVADSFPNKRIDFSIGKASYQVKVSLNEANLSIGDEINSFICNITMTTATLNAISKIYGDDEFVEVLRGDRCILLQVNGSKRLLISALIN